MSVKAYISGPMTGIAEHNKPAFDTMAKTLRAIGVEVVNPAEIAAESWHSAMRKDIGLLCECSHIVLLRGWEDSPGAQLELHIAHRLGIIIVTNPAEWAGSIAFKDAT